MAGWLESLPHILAADQFRGVVEAVAARARPEARDYLGFGRACDQVRPRAGADRPDASAGTRLPSPSNGSAAIHDFEFALAGHTSEDVEAVLPDGRFGAAEETGRLMNEAIIQGSRREVGIGEALGAFLCNSELTAPGASLLVKAYAHHTPVTVHVAIGTDTPHMHPAADGAAIGSGSHRDFRLFASCVTGLHDGGVYLNVGSAVVLPEVFLKAVSAVRNLGLPLAEFTTVNLDFLQHYRPRVNVVERPHAGGAGGRGYAITGHHELMIPLLAAALIEKDA